MCIIALQTLGAKLGDETIRTMFAGNPDGAGIMYAANGRVHWEKGFFDVEKLIEAWHRIPEGCVAAMHCRIATHGGVNSSLCHPFALTNSKGLYKTQGSSACMLMHNGVMSFMEKNKHFEKRDSDSSAYAKELFERFGSARLPDLAELEEIRTETERSNRILLLNGDGTFVTSGEWEYKDGVLYSNSHWKDWYSAYNTTYGGAYGRNWWYDDDDDAVPACRTKVPSVPAQAPVAEWADEVVCNDCDSFAKWRAEHPCFTEYSPVDGVIVDYGDCSIVDTNNSMRRFYLDGYDVYYAYTKAENLLMWSDRYEFLDADEAIDLGYMLPDGTAM